VTPPSLLALAKHAEVKSRPCSSGRPEQRGMAGSPPGQLTPGAAPAELSPSGATSSCAASMARKTRELFPLDLPQSCFERLVFPLGEISRADNRLGRCRTASGLRTASKPESQDLCLADHSRLDEGVPRCLPAAPSGGNLPGRFGTRSRQAMTHRALHHRPTQKAGRGLARAAGMLLRIDAP